MFWKVVFTQVKILYSLTSISVSPSYKRRTTGWGSESMLVLAWLGCWLKYEFGGNSMIFHLSPSAQGFAVFLIPPSQLLFFPFVFMFCSPTLLFLVCTYHCFNFKVCGWRWRKKGTWLLTRMRISFRGNQNVLKLIGVMASWRNPHTHKMNELCASNMWVSGAPWWTRFCWGPGISGK